MPETQYVAHPSVFEDRPVILNKDVIQNNKLSFQARGFYATMCLLAQLHPEKPLTLENALELSPNNIRDEAEAAFDELRRAGIYR